MFTIEWTDFNVKIEVELLDKENPELCKKFLQGLPFKTVFAASMSAGEMFKVPILFPLPSVVPDKWLLMPDQPDGTIYALGSYALIVKYGIVVEPFQLPIIGRMSDSELSNFKSIATKLRDAYFFTKEINKAIFRRKG
jgi:hypothetical protein